MPNDTPSPANARGEPRPAPHERTLVAVAVTVDMPAILAYAEITGDFNPLHVDPAFAATTAMGQPIAHGTLSMNLIWQSLAATVGNDRAARSSIDIRFARPVFAGDRVEAGGHVNDDDPERYTVWVRRQDGTNVIEGSAHIPPA
jgi:3-hydroxybutyryl-CoA dehydratase